MTTGLYRVGAAVRSALHERGFDLSKAQLQWDGAKKQIASLNGTQMTRYTGLANSVVNTIDEVNRQADEIKNSGVVPLNRLKMEAWAKLNGNSPMGQKVSAYLASVSTLTGELANLEQGGYAPTEEAWAVAKQQVRGDYGVKQLSASLTEVQKLINYRLQNIPNLNTVGPLSPNQYTGQPGSVPKIEQPGATPLPSGVTEEDIQHTMKLHNVTREQVLERLNAP